MDHSLCMDNMCQCEPTFVYNSSKCIPLYLDGFCKSNNDCNQILNARCSAGNVCVCDENHIKFSEKVCTPVLSHHCLEDEECIAINSICTMNKCQCKPHYVRRWTNLCELCKLKTEYYS
ncbi:uncharacterized protein LOC130670364 [Microplitis mediator]|uniref:uncharacterized protein LOC130670364 n=1 Tax=Microplitis mediator TaxID=375433 RepID=UPI002556BC6B|nr:uncharacterized protein LOC130670364 [Microplitis mediator]